MEYRFSEQTMKNIERQGEQITAQSIMTNEIAKKFKDLYVGDNWKIRAEELPLPTIEYLKKKRAEARNREG